MPTGPVLREAEIRAELTGTLQRWTIEDGALLRRYRTGDWKGSLLVVNAIGHVAEAAWHHPELLAGWGRVEVRLWSHDAGGVTARDLALARRIEEVVTWRPGGAGGLTGPPDEPRWAFLLPDPD